MRRCRLKPLEYELLRTFMRYPGMVLTREQLLRRVWAKTLGETRTIDVHVALLRRKLNWQEVIVTVYKVAIIERMKLRTRQTLIPLAIILVVSGVFLYAYTGVQADRLLSDARRNGAWQLDALPSTSPPWSARRR